MEISRNYGLGKSLEEDFIVGSVGHEVSQLMSPSLHMTTHQLSDPNKD